MAEFKVEEYKGRVIQLDEGLFKCDELTSGTLSGIKKKIDEASKVNKECIVLTTDRKMFNGKVTSLWSSKSDYNKGCWISYDKQGREKVNFGSYHSSYESIIATKNPENEGKIKQIVELQKQIDIAEKSIEKLENSIKRLSEKDFDSWKAAKVE